MTSAADTPSSLWMSTGNAAAVVGDGHRAVGVQLHLDRVAVAGERFVDGVVDHLVDHVVQARAVVGVADIHARPLAHRVQAAQHLDRMRRRSVGVAFGGELPSSVESIISVVDLIPAYRQRRHHVPASSTRDELGAARQRRNSARRCRSCHACAPRSRISRTAPSRRRPIEMGRHLVQQHQRRLAAFGRLQAGTASTMAISSVFCSPVEQLRPACRCRVAHAHVAAVRPDGAAALGIEQPRAAAQRRRSRSSAASAGPSSSHSSTVPRNCQARPRKRAARAPPRAWSRRWAIACRRAAATATPSAPSPLPAREPGRVVGAPLVAAAPAFAHRLLVGGDPRQLGRVDARHQTVEKSPPRRRPLREQAVHLRRQPDQAQSSASAAWPLTATPSIRTSRRSRAASDAISGRGRCRPPLRPRSCQAR